MRSSIPTYTIYSIRHVYIKRKKHDLGTNDPIFALKTMCRDSTQADPMPTPGMTAYLIEII